MLPIFILCQTSPTVLIQLSCCRNGAGQRPGSYGRVTSDTVATYTKNAVAQKVKVCNPGKVLTCC